jgi:hypothetical protein
MGVILPPQTAQGLVPERIRRALFNAVTPLNYPPERVATLLQEFAPLIREAYTSDRMVPQRQRAHRAAADDFAAARRAPTPYDAFGLSPGAQAFSEDAWAMYLGLDQPFKSIAPSPYTPTRASGVPTQYYTSAALRHPYTDPKHLRDVVRKAQAAGGTVPQNEFGPANYQASVGQDDVGPYVAIYDIWDLGLPAERMVGRPFELYDRVYYDPKTFKAIPTVEVEKARRQQELLRAMTDKRPAKR